MAVVGSSLLARGTYGSDHVTVLPCRLIPACAGNISLRSLRLCLLPAHPRLCGEHTHSNPDPAKAFGSSPLTRGTRPGFVTHELKLRLIPACAGNTWFTRTWRKRKLAHPRSRGEHRGARIRIPFSPGSSPLARGAQRVPAGLLRGLRLIPACAGNIPTRTLASWRWSAHPRSRGEPG